MSVGQARNALSRPLMDLSSAPEYDPYRTAAVQPPLLRFSGPSTHEATGSDLRRVCLTRLCYAFRLSQPLDVFFLPQPLRLCFAPVAPLGFALQRFAPLTWPADPLGLPAPPGVVSRPRRRDDTWWTVANDRLHSATGFCLASECSRNWNAPGSASTVPGLTVASRDWHEAQRALLRPTGTFSGSAALSLRYGSLPFDHRWPSDRSPNVQDNASFPTERPTGIPTFPKVGQSSRRLSCGSDRRSVSPQAVT
jgi:hypothetical protein